MSLDELRNDCAIKQKKGLHFILASVFIWIIVLMVQLIKIPILTKNLLTFCSTVPLLPLAYLISKFINVDFENKSNKLNQLGILFSLNQMLYLFIAMWIYSAVPEKLLMIIVMIFGAHLMPYGWLYKSNSYLIASIIIPILGLIVGVNFERYVLAVMMILIEIIFSISLIIENKKL